MNSGGLKVVTIGGGTGSFMLLRGLKHYVEHITAIVNMVDDGGSTGILRDELGALPPGDVRQCLVALSESPEVVRDLFAYRFDEDGSLGGHSFGNLFLTALEQVTGSFSEAVETASEVMAIRGQVVPVTLTNTQLRYIKPSGEVVVGEHAIGDSDVLRDDSRPQLSFTEKAVLNPDAATAISQADIVVIAPGTLYGSLAPTLMVEGMAEAMQATDAKIIYIANLTSEAETSGYDIAQICQELARFTGENCLDYVVVNERPIPPSLIERYMAEDQSVLSPGVFDALKVNVVYADVLADMALAQHLIRHDSDKVARTVMKLAFS